VASGTKPPSRRDSYVPKHASQGETAKARKKNGKSAGRKHTGRRSFLRRRWWLILLLAPFVLALLGFVGLWIAYARIQLPDRLPPIQTTYIYDRNGHLITTLHGAVNRRVIGLSAMSPHLIDAVIATEDHDFYNHPGVDVKGIVRAAYTDVIKHETVQGASTITQQLVKNVYAGTYQTDPETGANVYVEPERSIGEKIRESLLAVKLERELGKDKILAQYLNTVYFGHGAYGAEAAAETYFGKHASGLTVSESASLAGVLHAPELYDPIDRPSDNWYRRNYAIDQMVHYGYLDDATGDELKSRDCCGIPKSIQNAATTERLIAPGDAEYFVDYVRRDLIARYGEARVYGGGLQVTTTLDLGLQTAAEHAVAENLPSPGDPAAALVAMDPSNGQILAMVGGNDWERSKVNYATGAGGSGRQAGSAFKLFTLSAAIQQGYDLNAYWNGPSTMAIPNCPDPNSSDGLWHPVNAEGSGSYSLAGATAESVNTIFAQVIAQLGPQSVVDMAHALGIQSDLPPVCAITLGSVAVNPLEMTDSFGTIADEGVRHDPTPLLQVEAPGHKEDPSVASPGTQVLATNDADLVTYALQGVIREGTGAAAQVSGFPVAGKTGTAKNNVDAWFCGYTVQIVTCVWVGYPKGEIPLTNVEGVPSVYGGTIPASIWHDFMTVAMDGKDPIPFPQPSFDGYTVGPPTPAYIPPPSPTIGPCGEVVSATSSSSETVCPSATASPSPSTSSPKPTKPPSPTNSPTPTPTGSPPPTGTPAQSPKATKSPQRLRPG
jgi:penicillin-binding protein 1A